MGSGAANHGVFVLCARVQVELCKLVMRRVGQDQPDRPNICLTTREPPGYSIGSGDKKR